MSESDLLRAISPAGVAVFLLLPGTLTVIPVVVLVVTQLFVLAHGLALAKAIFPAFGVLAVLQIARYVLAKLPADHPCGLATAAATVIKAIGKGRWITFGQQLLV